MVEIKTPSIVVNFKTYEKSLGNNAIKLGRICENIAIETNKEIVICVNQLDIRSVKNAVSIPVFAQHADGYDLGSSTGKILPSELSKIGIKGTLLNHSEDRYEFEELEKAIIKCKENDIYVMVCVQNSDEAQKIASLNPDAIAIEPPELIGGDISVTTANPEIVSKSVELVKKINPSIKVFCGAGVKTGEDVAKAIELGSSGVLLASGVTKSENPELVLREMINNI